VINIHSGVKGLIRTCGNLLFPFALS